jgi:hypothetical protein
MGMIMKSLDVERVQLMRKEFMASTARWNQDGSTLTYMTQ